MLLPAVIRNLVGNLDFFLSFPTHLTGVDSLSLNWLRVVFASIWKKFFSFLGNKSRMQTRTPLALVRTWMIPRTIVLRCSTNQARLGSTRHAQGSALKRDWTALGMLEGENKLKIGVRLKWFSISNAVYYVVLSFVFLNSSVRLATQEFLALDKLWCLSSSQETAFSFDCVATSVHSAFRFLFVCLFVCLFVFVVASIGSYVR